MDYNKSCKRPKDISDLNILWAIRDIPKSILDLKLKGILAMFLSIIGNSGSCYLSMFQLEDKLGISERRARDHFLKLENLEFLNIKRPVHYTTGDSNEYSLNYKKILFTASRFKCDKSMGDETSGSSKPQDESSGSGGRSVR